MAMVMAMPMGDATAARRADGDRRRAARRLEAAVGLVRDYVRSWGRFDRVVFRVALDRFRGLYPDVAPGEAADCLARAVLVATAAEPALLWRDPRRAGDRSV